METGLSMFEELIQKIGAHDNYGPAMESAASRKASLVLNYHTHGPGSGYCVSICSKEKSFLPVLGQAAPLEELVHAKGIGQTEDQCLPLMAPLAQELSVHYGLESPPEIYLNGEPVSAP